MNRRSMNGTWSLLAVFAGSVLALRPYAVLSAQAPESPPSAETAVPPQASPSVRINVAGKASRLALMYYQGVWGVDSLRVKYTESGEMIRFSYRIVDPEKAAALNDKNAEPSLIDPQAGVMLKVPQMEKIGKLRQSSTPIAGKSYWMAFSNKGSFVKRGDHVDVVIGSFRAQGLVVE